MRTHIAKSLQTRCKAIQNAVKVYNAAASALSPPRPMVDWAKVSHYSFLDEFNLLRDTRQDIREKPWARPAHRETVKQYLRIQRAHEEILRCNVEIRRLYSAIVEEHQQFDIVLEHLRQDNHPILGAVLEYTTRRRRTNDHILAHIQQTFDLDGFSGDKTVGIKKGTSAPAPASSPIMGSSGVDGEIRAINKDVEEDDVVDVDDDDDEASGDIGYLLDYVSHLPIRS